VRTTPAAVAGKTEAILVTARGLPLYFYRPDTATKSFVTGGLAQLWPPLTSAAPTAAGLSGKLTVLNDAHGHQVAYNGHLLYTFTSDHPGQVSGQGFQNFFVATPGLAPPAAAAAGTVPAAPPGGGLGY
jgi:predicted lipoprotein with Yx(FWY)xxD motif